MKTKDAAKKIGVSKSTLLRWIQTGLIEDVHRDKRGWRNWRHDDVQKVKRYIKASRGTNQDDEIILTEEYRSNRALSLSMFRDGRFDRLKRKKKD